MSARGLDWSKHRTGPSTACRLCRGRTILRDENGQPCHKVCAELELEGVATRVTAPTRRGRR